MFFRQRPSGKERGMAYRFSDDFLAELRKRCDIEKVISRYVDLKQRGSNFVGLCPFHNEKTPSFHINTAEQYFYCFGCHIGGDVINFIQQKENLSYVDAVSLLAEQAGMKVPQAGEYDNRLSLLRKRILEMNKTAARFFFDCLQGPQGAAAREYMKKRQITPQSAVRFGLGYAPDSWDSLKKHLLFQGYTEDEIRDSGLVTASYKSRDSQDKPHTYDKFRNRLMFPIFDLRGNIIAFGGRALDPKEPSKYMNTAETLVFSKGSNLYAMNFAKASSEDFFILCEGYMDVLSLHQSGFSNAVACLGTALTKEQADLMKRYREKAVTCYDNDEAGKRATNKALSILPAAGIKVRVLSLHGGKDPDEILKTEGRDVFRRMLERSSDSVEYRIEEIAGKYNIEVPTEKAECMKECIPVLAGIANSVEQEIFVKSTAEKFSVSPENIYAEIREYQKRVRYAAKRKEERKIKTAIREDPNNLNAEYSQNLRAAKNEEAVLSVLLRFPEKLPFILENLGAEDFVTDFNRRMFLSLCSGIQESPGLEPIMTLSQKIDEKEMSKMTSLLRDAREISAENVRILQSISVIKEEKKKKAQKNTFDNSDETFELLINDLKKKKKDHHESGGNRNGY